MSLSLRLLCPALFVSVSFTATPALAGDPAAEMRERIEKLKKLHEEQRQLPMDAQFAMQEEQIAKYEDLVFKGNYQQETYLKLARERLQRLRREHLAQKWGRALDSQEANTELQKHGRRVAELKRIQLLARQRSQPINVVKARDLLQAENARHEALMRQLAAEAGVKVAAANPAEAANAAVKGAQK